MNVLWTRVSEMHAEPEFLHEPRGLCRVAFQVETRFSASTRFSLADLEAVSAASFFGGQVYSLDANWDCPPPPLAHVQIQARPTRY